MKSMERVLCRVSSRSRVWVALTLTIGAVASAQQPASDPPGASKAAEVQDSKSAARPDLVGRVSGSRKVPEATVFIFTAGPKVGTSTFCPSCYADCRKSARTDEQGTFKIESLDPQLIFRILVVAKGFAPKFVTKVDPADGPVDVYLQRLNLANVTPDRSIRGQVVDAGGKPIVGAVVESYGVRRKNDLGTRWGQLPGVDPLAVTDDQGEFLLSALEPFQGLDVRVEAGTFAKRQFSNLASGTNRHQLTLTEGVTVKGRVVRQGKPLAGISVGVVSADRGVENFTGNFDIGTDTDGRFAFVNLPPNVDYYIYGLMKSLQSYGAIPIRRIHVGADGTILDAGDLMVGPSQRLAGRLVCSDNRPVPPATRLLVSREQAWDSTQVQLDEEGRFDVRGLPSEAVSLSARVGGYHISPKNLSLDPLNSRLVGRMDQDVTNLVFLLDKGPDTRSGFDSQLPESEWPQNQRLRGAESLPDHSSQWLIAGRVHDSQSGQSIERFQVTLGNAQAFMNRTSWEERSRTEGTNGQFVAYLNKRFGQPVLKLEAEGYLPRRLTLQPESRTNLDFELQKGAGPHGLVLLPDGTPAPDASLALLCAGDQQVSLTAKGELQCWQKQDRVKFTEPDGSFAVAPELDMLEIAITAEAGFKLVAVEELATNSRVKLEPWGKIKGVLHRASNLSSNEDLDLALQQHHPGPGPLSLQFHTTTDDQVRFEFDHVPPGNLQINGRNMINTHAWSWDPLEKVSLKPGAQLELDIHAPAKSQRAPNFGPPDLAAKSTRRTGPGPQGVVLLPNGKPAVDAEVALLAPGKYVAVGKGALKAYEARQEGLAVRTGNGGHFALPGVEGATGIVAVHDEGFAYVPLEKLKASAQVQLERWGRIEGILHIGRRLGTNELVGLESGNPFFDDSHVMLDMQDFQARTDDQGKFVITFVPPGEQRIARLIATGPGRNMHSAATSVTVRPGAVTSVVVGGTGRTVIGKVRLKEQPVDWDTVHASLHTRMSDGFKQPRSPEEQKAWSASPEAKAARKNYRVYPVLFAKDGSFSIEEVQPGKYQFDLMLMSSTPPEAMNLSPVKAHSQQDVVVPEAPGKEDLAAADLGTLECPLEPFKQRAANAP